jgi:hypothetical protein
MRASIHFITPDNFIEEVISEERPILILCMPQDDDFPSQLRLMHVLAGQHQAWLKVGLLEDAFIENFKMMLGVAGTPTFLVFHGGKEKGRMLGLLDHRGLEEFVLEVAAD